MNPLNLLLGSALSICISGLKKIGFVKNNPKIVSAIISTAIPAGIAVYGQIKGVDVGSWQELVGQAGTLFAASVATHEAVVQPIKDIQLG